MGFIKRELIQFLDGLVELASEENKVKAVLTKEKFLSDFEKTYGYEKEIITEVSKLPPHYYSVEWRTTRRLRHSRIITNGYSKRKIPLCSYVKTGNSTVRCLIVKSKFIYGKRNEKVQSFRESDCKKHYH